MWRWWCLAQPPILLKGRSIRPLLLVMAYRHSQENNWLITRRMALRPPRLSDARAIFEAWGSDPVVTQYLTWTPARSVVDTEIFLRDALSRTAAGEEHSWLMTPLNGPGAMGMISAWQDGPQAELGFVLARRWWNGGYMTEALRAVLDWCEAREDIQQVWAVCDIDNLASALVLEKVGMSSQGLVERWAVHPNVSRERRDCLAFARIF